MGDSEYKCLMGWRPRNIYWVSGQKDFEWSGGAVLARCERKGEFPQGFEINHASRKCNVESRPLSTSYGMLNALAQD